MKRKWRNYVKSVLKKNYCEHNLEDLELWLENVTEWITVDELNESKHQLSKNYRVNHHNLSVNEEPEGNRNVAKNQSSDSVTKKTRYCFKCNKEGHDLEICRNFAGLSVENRRGLVRKKNLCFLCLRKEVCVKIRKKYVKLMVAKVCIMNWFINQKTVTVRIVKRIN
jgi:hypothetical protein